MFSWSAQSSEWSSSDRTPVVEASSVMVRSSASFLIIVLGMLCLVPWQGLPGQATKPADSSWIRPKRPTVSRPTEFQAPGVLQLELGFDGAFGGADLREHNAMPVTVSLAASTRVLLELNADAITWRVPRGPGGMTGFGDLTSALQLVLDPDSVGSRSFGLGLAVKWPTARSPLGSGRIDYKLVGKVSGAAVGADIDLNAALLLNGRAGGLAIGVQGTTSLGWDLSHGLGFEAELSAQSLDTDLDRGVFTSASLTADLSPAITIDLGIRAGLSRTASPWALFGGATIGLTRPTVRTGSDGRTTPSSLPPLRGTGSR